MNVLIFTVVLDSREVEVDDMHNITNVKTTSGDTSSDHDRSLACAKSTPDIVNTISESKAFDSQCVLTLALSAIRVDRGGRQTVVEQEVVDEVRSLLGLDEDQGTRRWHRDQEIVQSLLLCVALNPDDLIVVSEVHGR